MNGGESLSSRTHMELTSVFLWPEARLVLVSNDIIFCNAINLILIYIYIYGSGSGN